MFKIKYQDLRSDPFKQTMIKLAKCGDYPYKVSYNIMRMAKALEAVLVESNKEWHALAASLVQKDEKGGLKFNEDRTDFLWLEGVTAEDGKKKVEEFANKEVIVDRHKLSLVDIAAAKLTPADMANIEFMLVEPLSSVE